jgi:hypothetical protein
MNLTHPQMLIVYRLQQGASLRTRAFGMRGPKYRWAWSHNQHDPCNEQSVDRLIHKGVLHVINETGLVENGADVLLTQRGKGIQLPARFIRDISAGRS